MPQDHINTKALFTDQTESFLKVLPIRPPTRKGRKRYAIRIRLRTAAGEVDRAVLLTDDEEIPMHVERESKWFIFFAAEVETGWDPLRYAFRLRLAESGREVIYMRSDDRKKLIRAKDLLEEYIAANKGFQEIHVMFDFS